SFSAHPPGEQSLVVANERLGGVDLDSFFGPVRVEWDHEAALTPLGQLPFFIHFLKASGLFDALVADCLLRYGSPNAPKKRDVVGTAMLAMLPGRSADSLPTASVTSASTSAAGTRTIDPALLSGRLVARRS